MSALIFSGCNKNPKSVVNLTVWCSADDQELLKNITDDFKRHYSSSASFEITICEEGEMTCKDTVLFNPEIAADVYTFAGDQLSKLAKSNALSPVSFDKENVLSDNGGENSAIIEAASYNDTLMAYPCTASNGYFLFYNSSYFNENDVKSLDTMLEIAAANNKKVCMDLSSGWYLYSFFKAAGLDTVINDDEITCTSNWNSTSGDIKGVDVLSSVLKIAGHEGFLSCGNDDSLKEIEDGNVIAFVSGTWNATFLEDEWKDNYEATILPHYTVNGKSLQMHSVSGYKMIGVNPYSKESEWAHKLARWITNEDNQLYRFQMRGEGPSNVNIVKNEFVQSSKAIAALSEQAEFAHIQMVSDSYWVATYKLGTIITAKNLENTDLQELLDELVTYVSTKQE